MPDPKANNNMQRGYFEKISFIHRLEISMNYNESFESWGWALYPYLS
jgi:hypothetical protein